MGNWPIILEAFPRSLPRCPGAERARVAWAGSTAPGTPVCRFGASSGHQTRRIHLECGHLKSSCYQTTVMGFSRSAVELPAPNKQPGVAWPSARGPALAAASRQVRSPLCGLSPSELLPSQRLHSAHLLFYSSGFLNTRSRNSGYVDYYSKSKFFILLHFQVTGFLSSSL